MCKTSRNKTELGAHKHLTVRDIRMKQKRAKKNRLQRQSFRKGSSRRMWAAQGETASKG